MQAVPEPCRPGAAGGGGSFWSAVARLPFGGGVMADWRRAAAGHLPLLRPFLRVGAGESAGYPCPADPPCHCRHEVVGWGDERVAVCRCGECDPVRLERGDLQIYRVDVAVLGEAICALLPFRAHRGVRPCGSGGVAAFWQIGTWMPLAAPVYFASCATHAVWNGCVHAAGGRPFVLLATGVVPGFGAPPGAGLLLELEVYLGASVPGVFSLLEPPGPVLDGWREQVSGGGGVAQILNGIHREIAGVRADFVALKSARDHLQQMQGAGLLDFARRVDMESFKQLAAILAVGDVAKASRALGMKDATLRSAMATWRDRGPAYVAMLELVRWRKKTTGRAKVPLNEEILHDRAERTDLPGLLSDVLEGLLSMNNSNWEQQCEDLKDLLRSAGS